MKQFILHDGRATYTIHNSDELYFLYNDWLMDILEGVSLPPSGVFDEDGDEICSRYIVENIREWHNEVWEEVPEGEYDLRRFEALAMNALDGGVDIDED